MNDIISLISSSINNKEDYESAIKAFSLLDKEQVEKLRYVKFLLNM